MVPTNELEGYRKPPRARRALLAALVVAAVGVVGWLAWRPAPSKPMPSFDLPLLSGKGRMSSATLQGAPVVINFFASWCTPCRDEAPVLEAAWRRHRADGVRFVGVAIRDTRGDARRFVRSFGITFPVVFDPDQKLARALDVFGLPQTFFVTRDWELLGVSAGRTLADAGGGRPATLGAISRRALERQIDHLLEA